MLFKYGVLSTLNGRLVVTWTPVPDGDAPVILFVWKETGVEIADLPSHRGCGST